MLEPKIFDYVIHQFGKTEIDVCIQADEANSDICFLASRPRIIPYRCLYYKLEYTYLCLPLRMLQKIQEECKKTIVKVPLWIHNHGLQESWNLQSHHL